jgi:hypothetical protein
MLSLLTVGVVGLLGVGLGWVLRGRAQPAPPPQAAPAQRPTPRPVAPPPAPPQQVGKDLMDLAQRLSKAPRPTYHACHDSRCRKRGPHPCHDLDCKERR